MPDSPEISIISYPIIYTKLIKNVTNFIITKITIDKLHNILKF